MEGAEAEGFSHGQRGGWLRRDSVSPSTSGASATQGGRSPAGLTHRQSITYMPMAHGFVYLAAVMDWKPRLRAPTRSSIHGTLPAKRVRETEVNVHGDRHPSGQHPSVQPPKAVIGLGSWHDARKPATPKDVRRDGVLLR